MWSRSHLQSSRVRDAHWCHFPAGSSAFFFFYSRIAKWHEFFKEKKMFLNIIGESSCKRVRVSVSLALRVWDKGFGECPNMVRPFDLSFSAESRCTPMVKWRPRQPCIKRHPPTSQPPFSFCPFFYIWWPWNIAPPSCIQLDQYSSQQGLPPPDYSRIPDELMHFVGTARSLCFTCTSPALLLCCSLQRGGGVHGATLQAPALRRQETSVWRQEEHLHGASTSYWEWEGTRLKWIWIT